MNHSYRTVQWNPQKRRYDLALWSGIGLYLLIFIGGGLWHDANADAMTLAIRGSATAAFILLTLILCIGPLARLSPVFLPLLYNRRHMGVSMFLLASTHVLLVLLQFHAQGTINPLVSLLSSGWPRHAGSPFPFEVFGIVAWMILLLMAVTSHDFWLANLTPPLWKVLHMLVYGAYGLLTLHIALGTLQQETSRVYTGLLVGAASFVFGLQLIAGWREFRGDRPLPARTREGYVHVVRAADIPDGRAITVTLSGERVAVFRDGQRVCALSAVCRHQNGPLGEGRIIDGLVTCPWHGYQYRPEDGCSPPPFTEKIPTFRVRVDGDEVFVDPRPLPPGTAVSPAAIGIDAISGADKAREFYVGYLDRAPPRLGRWLKAIVVLLWIGGAFLAGVWISAQRRFDAGVFEFGAPRHFEGIVVMKPYPSLLVERLGVPGTQPAFSRYLLAGPGKQGADALVAPYDGQAVSLSGELIYRDLQTMIKLDHDSIQRLPADGRDHYHVPALELQPRAMGAIEVQGEIVDPQCYFGIMKPGFGVPHRACAIRCLAGGVPPVLRGRTLGSVDTPMNYFLLLGPDGTRINAQLLPQVGETLKLKGQSVAYGDLLALEIDPASLRTR